MTTLLLCCTLLSAVAILRARTTWFVQNGNAPAFWFLEKCLFKAIIAANSTCKIKRQWLFDKNGVAGVICVNHCKSERPGKWQHYKIVYCTNVNKISIYYIINITVFKEDGMYFTATYSCWTSWFGYTVKLFFIFLLFFLVSHILKCKI